ncbi:FTR1 family protein [Clostridium sp. OS1-26]|uniref:FTR1 family iron permease n=1 Tax=Clostridium sp. OS1-26 TaxID=3070681 RepID=UPI0027DFAE18|nr:FTR1 family protein [Clostridium sp. OS1-26]WML37112.1 FTR1 family protein [Clostridium sp. OS1-26]
MVTTMIIAFRESFEMLLVIVPLLVYLSKINREDLKKYLYAGSGSGVALSVLTGVIIFNQAKSIDAAVQHIFQGAMMLFLAALILYSIVLLRKQSKAIPTKEEDNVNVKITAVSLFTLAFLTIFRESLEITIFTLPFINEAATNIAIGIILGALISIVLMYLVYKQTLKLSIELIFNALTIILILIGALMFGEGLAELMPSMGESIERAGELIYAIPTLYIFLKDMMKKYIKKL